jgi:hypothetical protein
MKTAGLRVPLIVLMMSKEKRRKKEKRLSIIERMGKKSEKKRKLYTAMHTVGVWRLPIMGYRWVF